MLPSSRCFGALFARLAIPVALGLAILPGAARSQSGASPDGVWREVAPAARGGSITAAAPTYRVFDIDTEALGAILARVPSEGAPAPAGGVVLTLPVLGGAYERFEIHERAMFAPAVAPPGIRTFIAQGLDDPTRTATFVESPAGTYAFIHSPDGMIYMEPNGVGNTQQSISYTRRDLTEAPAFECGVEGNDVSLDTWKKGAGGPETLVAPSGPTLSTYQLAVSATGEFTQFFDPGGGTANTLSQIAASVAAVNAIYLPEVTIQLVVVCNNVFTDPTMDPFTNSDDSNTSIGQNQTTTDANCGGSAGYDIGHVFHRRSGGGFSGLAGGNTCNNGNKAMGYSSVNNPVPATMVWVVDQLSHEMGHQFSAAHSFNSNVTGCAGNRVGTSAYEPGSGSTIMSYAAGTRCDYDFPQTNDGYFHGHSFDQITTYRDGGGACGVTSATGNTAPTVNAGANYTIPQGTPFTLTASGSDADGHPLTYCWEQFDLGNPPDLATNVNGPLFRSRPPTTSPARTFPILSDILAGNPTPTEILPLVNRTLNFRCTVRDNRAFGGGVNNDAMVITVAGAAFVVNAPNGGETLHANCLTTVTWTVGGGNVAANVNILLSTNGGTSFPITLASNVPNDGSHEVQLPCNATTTQGRIRIEPTDNIFFDVSNTNFTITNDTPVSAVTASGGDVGATCEFVAPYSATITDDCEVDETTVLVAAVSLDGLATVDAPTVNVNVISATEVQVSGTVRVSALTGCPANVRITVSAQDACGVLGTDSEDIQVIDSTPPEITVTLNRTSLWPPNHQLATIQATVVVSDNCPNTTWVLQSVTSNEPEDDGGDGNTAPDIVADIGTADTEFQLRSERQGDGNGRVYTVVYQVSDACGNSEQAVAEVVVPHNRPASGVASTGITDPGSQTTIPEVAVIVLGGAEAQEGTEDIVARDSGPRATAPVSWAPLDPRMIETPSVQAGNLLGVASPTAWEVADANQDGRVDALFWFRGEDLQAIEEISGPEDGPVALYFETVDQVSYLIPDISALERPGRLNVLSELRNRATLIVTPGVTPGMTAIVAPIAAAKPVVESMSTTEILGIHPNPFGKAATIHFQLATEGAMDLAVFDLRGARVRTLASGRGVAGRHQALWDGKDDAGRRLPRGVYLIRFSAGQLSRTHKAVLMQ